MSSRYFQFIVCLGLVVGTSTLHAAIPDEDLPHNQPRVITVPKTAAYLTANGAVTITGYNDMREMLEALGLIFVKTHPGIRFEWDLRGTRFAPAALAAGTSAFAPMGAEFTPAQLADFREKTSEEPLAIRVAHASLNPQALSGPLAIFVHRDNPLSVLTLKQVAQIFTGEVTHWGELGLERDWAERSISTYGVERDRVLALLLKDKTFSGREFAKQMRGFPQSADVVRHVAEDVSGIGFAAAMRTITGVRTLALAMRVGDEPVAPTQAAIMAGTYPLDRHLLIYVRRPILPVARAFLQLVLSAEGQAVIAAASQGYLPLAAGEVAAERAKLE